MKILLDLNILLDVVQKRDPHYYASAQILSKVLADEMTGVLPGHAITTIYYIVAKHINRKKADDTVDWMVKHFEVVAAEKPDFIRARSLKMTDFEDAVTASLAERAGCDYIVTRNTKDFVNAPIPGIMPSDLLHLLQPDT